MFNAFPVLQRLSEPDMRQIQETVVAAGERRADFIGGRDWIGTNEAGRVLDADYDVSTEGQAKRFPTRLSSNACNVLLYLFMVDGCRLPFGHGVFSTLC
jgi:hypothetical protein